MTTRTRQRMWTFRKPFRINGVDHELPAGDYQVTTDEELLEGLSFPVYRRIATSILVAAADGDSVDIVSIDPANLRAVHENDAQDDTAAFDKSSELGPGKRLGSDNGQ